MNKLRRMLIRGAITSAGATTAWLARAQAYPSRPVKIIVPFPPGGPTDAVARMLAQKLTDQFGQPFVVENKPGAGGAIGAEIVAKAPADGYTLLIGTTSHAIIPALYAKTGYDIRRDLVPITLLTKTPLILAIHPAVPVRTVGELVALSKSGAGNVTYASSGNGTSTHLAAELFVSMTGAQMQHVPYKGSAPALNDLMGGQVTAMFDLSLSMLPFIKSGRLRALAVTSAKRSPVAPDLPTLAESGIAGYEATAWNGLLAPAATPKAIVDDLNRVVRGIFAAPDIVQSLTASGSEIDTGSPQDFESFLNVEIEKWARAVRSSGAVTQ